MSNMRPDERLFREEVRTQLKEALAEYARERQVSDVLVYLASHQLDWNTLQRRAHLSPSKLKTKIGRVRRFVRRRLADYLED
jgi:hypothetical protein